MFRCISLWFNKGQCQEYEIVVVERSLFRSPVHGADDTPTPESPDMLGRFHKDIADKCCESFWSTIREKMVAMRGYNCVDFLAGWTSENCGERFSVEEKVYR